MKRTAQKWKEYDPTWLVEMAVEQMSDEPWLPEALRRCTQCLPVSQAYIRFVPSTDWEYEESLVLEHTEGDIVLDILKGKRVGGAEFLKYVPQ